MNATRHPSDATLVAYGSGGLVEALALVVATHLALCGDCRRKAATVEAVGGALLDELPPAAVAEDALARTLSRLGTVEARKPAPARLPAKDGFSLPAPLRAYLGDSVSDANWRFLAPGIGQITVQPRGRGGASVRLLRIKPGTAVMHHGHGGIELTAVLAGGYTDERGHFGAGDFAEIDESAAHRPAADPGADCICLVAESGKPHFTGWLGRLLAPFLRG